MMKLLWKIFLEEIEFKRQVAHLVFGLSYATAFLLGWIDPVISSGLFLLAIFAGLWLKKRRNFVDKVVLLLERKHHLSDIPLKGLIFYLLGATLTISLFDFLPALSGILVLAIADSIGTLYGKYLGVVKIRWNPDKHMEGPILGGLISTIMLVSFIPFPAAVAGSYVGAFIDTLKIRIFGIEIDDNLLIPLVSAGVIQIMLTYGPL